jgi:[acyl-carrier-protein] S-malonyltransferase
MGRDMTGTGRYPPQPKYPPFAFYSCVRLGDPEQLQLIMDMDPYYITQDNGAGAPIHFATTYKQLDMLHHLIRKGAEVNQRDDKGFTALHRAAYLAQYEGYLQIYEYLLSEGADPNVLTNDYDPYLNPGKKTPIEVAIDDPEVRAKLKALEAKYAKTAKKAEPHADIGDWWALYDYGLDAIKTWKKDYSHPYPEVQKRQKDAAEKSAFKEERRQRRAAAALQPKAKLVKQAPKTPIVFLFPGQGSQAVGMINECKDLPAVKEMFVKAKEILGYDLLQVCLEGPKSKIDDTQFSQPALFVGGLCAVEKLKAENPAAYEGVSCTAGLSLGEYTALVFAGVLSFEDGLKVVKARAENMAACAKMGDPHGMLTVVGLGDADLENICKTVREKMPGKTCQLANFLFPQGRVCSGHKDALDEVQKMATANGALKAQAVAVSGAFHTGLMGPARDAVTKVLAEVTINEPRIPVYSNVTAQPFTSAAEIPGMLGRQLCEPVLWEQTMKNLIAEGKNQCYELGPGQQLKAMSKRIDSNVWKAFKVVNP